MPLMVVREADGTCEKFVSVRRQLCCAQNIEKVNLIARRSHLIHDGIFTDRLFFFTHTYIYVISYIVHLYYISAESSLIVSRIPSLGANNV